MLNWTDILLQHGRGLVRLEVQEWESDDPADPRPVLSSSQLGQINGLCPMLKDISIDVNRNGAWPYHVLDTIASFENVQRLALWFEAGIDQHQHESRFHKSRTDSYRQPLVNTSAALSLFRYLRERKAGQELRHLTLYVGDWGREYGKMMKFQGWGEGREERYECNVVDRHGTGFLEERMWCDGNSDIVQL